MMNGASDDQAFMDMLKKFYTLLFVDKKDAEERLRTAEEPVLSNEIERMLQEEEGPVSVGPAADPLPAIRVLPLSDQLNSLEKTLTAYTTVLRRNTVSLKSRIHDFRINDSCVQDQEQ